VACHHPEIDSGLHVLLTIDHAAQAGFPLHVRWACLLHDLGKGETPDDILPHHYAHESRSEILAAQVSARLKAPVSCREFAILFAREHGIFGKIGELRAQTIVKVLERCDVSRRPERFSAMLDAASCDYFGRGGDRPAPWPPGALWQAALEAISAVDAGALARECRERQHIPASIHAARVAAVRARLGQKVDMPTRPRPHSRSPVDE
jgi:tRNA nucleotidyltransferase (CCA-adding enzyme)